MVGTVAFEAVTILAPGCEEEPKRTCDCTTQTPVGVTSPWCSVAPGAHLQEVLAGANESKLSAGTVGLSLAAPDSLDQVWDLVCHCLVM